MSARFFGEAASRCTISCGNLDNVDLSDRGSISRALTNDARNNFAAGLGALALAPHDLGVGQTFRGAVGLPLDTVQGIGALVTTDPRTTIRGIGNSLANPFSSLRACPPGNLVCVGANAPGPADVVFGEAAALGTARTFSLVRGLGDAPTATPLFTPRGAPNDAFGRFEGHTLTDAEAGGLPPISTATPARGQSAVPRDSFERQLFSDVTANPTQGRDLGLTGDPRFSREAGWQKRELVLRTANGSVTIHYQYNTRNGAILDRKIVNNPSFPPPTRGN